MQFDYKVAFKTNLKTIREEKQLSQKDLASKLNVPVSTYANWEQGRTEPNVDMLRKLGALFKVSLDDLING